MVPGVWEIFRADCTVILRYCKSKSGRKCKSYCTLKHQRILNLQFAQFFKGLKRGLLTKIRCSLCLQGMVLDGLKGFQAKKSKSMTFNYKSCISYLVLAQKLNGTKVTLISSEQELGACGHPMSHTFTIHHQEDISSHCTLQVIGGVEYLSMIRLSYGMIWLKKPINIIILTKKNVF